MNKKPAPDPLLETIGCNSKVDYPMLQCGRGKYSYHCNSIFGPYQFNGCTN